MTIREIISTVSKTKENKDQVYIGSFAEEVFDLQFIQNYDNQEKLVSYYFGDWHCTDQQVGYKVYFFNDEPAIVSMQLGRKMHEDFEWISVDIYNKVKEYVLSFQDKPEDSIDLVDLDGEFGDTYKVRFYSQMYTHHKKNAIHNGAHVEIIDHKDSYNDKETKKYFPELVKIKYADGTTKWLKPEELDFKFNII